MKDIQNALSHSGDELEKDEGSPEAFALLSAQCVAVERVVLVVHDG